MLQFFISGWFSLPKHTKNLSQVHKRTFFRKILRHVYFNLILQWRRILFPGANTSKDAVLYAICFSSYSVNKYVNLRFISNDVEFNQEGWFTCSNFAMDMPEEH